MSRRDIEEDAEETGETTSRTSAAKHMARDHAEKDSETNFTRGDPETNGKPLIKDREALEKRWSDDNGVLANISRFFGGNG